MNGNSGIYMIFNTANAKCYVGSAVNLRKRWNQHIRYLNSCNHHSRHLQNAWNKYGMQDFRFYKIVACSKEELLKLEQLYIDQLKPEYNMAPKAGNVLGIKHSDETRRKMSEAHKGHNHNLGKKASEETRRKLSEIAKNRSDETRRKISEVHKGKRHSDESRRKMSEAKKKAYQDPEYHRKISASNTKKGKKHSDETRRKMSEAHKNMSDETRRKLSEAKKKYWAEKRKQVSNDFIIM